MPPPVAQARSLPAWAKGPAYLVPEPPGRFYLSEKDAASTFIGPGSGAGRSAAGCGLRAPDAIGVSRAGGTPLSESQSPKSFIDSVRKADPALDSTAKPRRFSGRSGSLVYPPGCPGGRVGKVFPSKPPQENTAGEGGVSQTKSAAFVLFNSQ